MYTYENHKTYIHRIPNGLDTSELPPNTSAMTNIKHGDIRDLSINYYNTNMSAISKDTIKAMEQWGLHKQIQQLNTFTIRFDVYTRDRVLTKNTLTGDYKQDDNAFNYDCNPREVFRTLNKIKNSVSLLNQVNVKPVKNNTPPSVPTDTYLLHLCIQPVENTLQILKEIRTKNLSLTNIIATINHIRFKHKLKIIHPTTVWFYQKRK